MVTSGVTPVIPVSKCVITNAIEEWMRNKHESVDQQAGLSTIQTSTTLDETQLEGHPKKRQR